MSNRKYGDHVKAKNDLPTWYWKSGLHDATITDVCEIYLPVNYSKHTGRWNCLEVSIDSKSALFDTTVTAIRFYNYSSTLDKQVIGWHWKDDSLAVKGIKYCLNIALSPEKQARNFLIMFEDCDVVRK